jgi:outer membrane protein assembly factor BamB
MGRLRLVRVAAALAVALAIAYPTSGQGATFTNWPGYLFGPRHANVNEPAVAITPSNAGSLSLDWHWMPHAKPGRPPPSLFASPTVYNGVIYVGAFTGVFYALDEATGNVLWHRSFAPTPELGSASECIAKGFVSTAAVTTDPSRGGQVTVYVAAPDGYLYALKASDGTTVWSSPVAIPSATEHDYFNWSSAAVSGGSVYVGISSDCDHPLVRGGLRKYSQATGQRLATYFAVPKGAVGGSIWSSPAVDDTLGFVFVSTGNQDPSGTEPGDSFSIVRLNASDLSKQESWTAPEAADSDYDFGSSPTIFYADLDGVRTEMVGAYYALRASNVSAGPVWSRQIADPAVKDFNSCLASGIWDFKGSRVYLASSRRTAAGVIHPGGIREVDPATGQAVWIRNVRGGPVMGSPTMDGGGVIAAATWTRKVGAKNSIYLLDASTGAVLDRIVLGGYGEFAQPVFADNHLLVATVAGGLYAYAP